MLLNQPQPLWPGPTPPNGFAFRDTLLASDLSRDDAPSSRSGAPAENDDQGEPEWRFADHRNHEQEQRCRDAG
jgi:hypothetical protein